MKPHKITLIHTSAVLIPVFTQLADIHLPGSIVQHVTDDSLLKEAIARGSLSQSIVDRLQQHVVNAEQAGAELIMVTCSSMGPAIEAVESVANVPVKRVDRAMADRAVALGSKIGVIATVSTTLQPTADLIQRRAEAAGKSIEIILCLCEGALEKLLAGELETHDRMVKNKLTELMTQVDVIVLAQASMARVADQLDADQLDADQLDADQLDADQLDADQLEAARGATPVLSSPRLAMESLARELNVTPHE